MFDHKGYLLDANAWLALVVEKHVHHQAIYSFWKNIPSETPCFFCRVTQMSFLRLLCNKQVMGESRLTMTRAWNLYDELLKSESTSFMEEFDSLLHESEWRKLTQTKGASGSTWTDAYLATFAFIGNLSILTFDQGFRNYPSIQTTILKA